MCFACCWNDQERLERRRLHNKLLDMMGTIRVVCRVRPVLALETKQLHGGSSVTGTGSGGNVVVSFPSNRAENDTLLVTRDARFPQARARYEFDRVLPPSATQADVFETVQPLCVSVLDGYNVCLFAYGQTG